jgi:hypothetical protein
VSGQRFGGHFTVAIHKNHTKTRTKRNQKAQGICGANENGEAPVIPG